MTNEIEEVHEEGGIGHIVKTTFIVCKITIVSTFLICAMYRYIKKYKQCTFVAFLLGIYVVMLSVLMVMDLTVKIIPVFFVLILLANYFNFIGFWYILRTLPCL